MTMTSRFADMTPSSIFLTFFCSSYWSKFHVNIITGSGVMTVFFYKGLTINPEIENTLVWVLPDMCSGCHYYTTSFNKAWTQLLRRFKSCTRRVGDSFVGQPYHKNNSSPNMARMPLMKCYYMLQNVTVTAFAVSKLLRENQQGVG